MSRVVIAGRNSWIPGAPDSPQVASTASWSISCLLFLLQSSYWPSSSPPPPQMLIYTLHPLASEMMATCLCTI